MYYYEIWVNSPRYVGNKPLTYSSERQLKRDSLVLVDFQGKLVVGLVEKKVTKPSFSTKKIDKLLTNKTLPTASKQLFNWLSTYYPSPRSNHLKLFLPQSLAKINESRDVYKQTLDKDKTRLPKLTTRQEEALNAINNSSRRTILLYGDTGSGKTRLYIELIIKSINEKRSALVLTPEIGLTPQLLNTLEQSFSGKVVLVHSNLTPKERRVSWIKLLTASEPLVIVGPRSALFAPVKDVGVIIIDEAHDAGYKQEQAPHYQTSRVAAKLADLHTAKLILGTATPLISDYFVLEKIGQIVRLEGQAIEHQEGSRQASIVSLLDRNSFKKSYWLSDALIKSISTSLSQQEQSLIFLNRRGTSPTIVCQNCGWQALCPNCDTPLTYHGDSHKLICHSCSYNHVSPINCPQCNNDNILFKGVGTKAIAEALKLLFPHATIKRFDKDNKKTETLGENFEDVVNGKFDILVGTQILTKGFDLPKLSTVGVIVADSSLAFPDYTAEERTFQIITQVIGRVARGHRSGHVVIQTYNPDSPIIKEAIARNYLDFYNTQLIERKSFNFPPYVYLLKVSCKRSSVKKAKEACNNLISLIKEFGLAVIIEGPSPAFHEKSKNKYVWQIVIKSRSRSNLLKIIDKLPQTWSYDIDPSSLL